MRKPQYFKKTKCLSSSVLSATNLSKNRDRSGHVVRPSKLPGHSKGEHAEDRGHKDIGDT